MTLRPWQVEGGCHTIINFSVKHPVGEEQAGLEGSPITVILWTGGSW